MSKFFCKKHDAPIEVVNYEADGNVEEQYICSKCDEDTYLSRHEVYELKPSTGIPALLGECADRLRIIDEEKKRLTARIRELDDYAGILKAHLQVELPKIGSTSIAGFVCRAELSTKDHYSVNDKESFLQYVFDNDAYDLVTSHVNQRAVGDRVTEGDEEIPGVSSYTSTVVKLSKLH